MMEDRRKAERACLDCKKVLPKEEFYTKVIKNVIYSQSRCKKCTNKMRYQYHLDEMKVKPPGIEDSNRKRCHTCMKVKDFDEFGDVGLGSGIIVKANNCVVCENERDAIEIQAKSYNYSDSVNDSDRSDYYCAFVGNLPYEEICAVYRIRHSEPLLKEETYREMRNK